MTEAEAAQRLMEAILVVFADRDDDEQIPVRMFIGEVGEACGVRLDAWRAEDCPEWETVGWLRTRARSAFNSLSDHPLPDGEIRRHATGEHGGHQ